MSVSETILSSITEAVFGYVLEQTGLGDWVREKIKDKNAPQRMAFTSALKQAFEAFAQQHPEWVASNFDASFFEHEGAPVLAQFLWRDGHPDPSDLAARWADSLNLHNPERRTRYVRDLEPIAADFLDSLAHALKQEPDLAELHDSRAFEQIAKDVAALRAAIGADRATPGTCRDYLHWLIERNLYLDPRGVMQTQRQVQVKLDEVYVSLQAQHEATLSGADKQVLEAEFQRLAADRLAEEELEDRRELLVAQVEQRQRKGQPNVPGETLELAAAVTRHDKLVIRGDPGGGKTTLLRYLALKHAEALWHGQVEADADLKAPRFPIFIRIADYAESGAWRERALSDFLAPCCTRLECPASGLADLLEQELARGNCLVLLDGLDEIVSADERRGVVQQIEHFVRRHDDRQNRFVITSRVAGYSSAPLGPPFTHVMIQEMNDAQIHRFLERWCPAVEAAQTPELSPEARQITAQREIDGILDAMAKAPGVRRLAANPLMLRILALIHRTGAQLPQKRIALYKLAAETLARTWRTAQGVPESALVQEEYLTRLLGKLAYWMHQHKPTGIATQQEVYTVLGAEWAAIRRLPWDADDPHPDIIAEVETFLQAVREHTGLFVERAPRRYGFMHLTFEEYYAARYLVARSRTRAKLIRQHLHDPRWDEPILLALGFVGLDYPQEAAELLETAILAQGEAAEEEGLTSSHQEDLLGRDFLFALRCLADQIPTDPLLVQRLVERLVDEWLYQHGSGRFQRYRQALAERAAQLQGSSADPALIRLLTAALRDDHPDVRSSAAGALGRLEPQSPEVVPALLAALRDDHSQVRDAAAFALGRLGPQSPEVVPALLAALRDDHSQVRDAAAGALGRLEPQSPEVVPALLAALRDDHPQVRDAAAGALGQLEPQSPEVVSALLATLRDDTPDVRGAAAFALGQLEPQSPEVVPALLATLRDDHPQVRGAAAGALGNLGPQSPEVVPALLATLRDDHPDVRGAAAFVLGNLGPQSPEVVPALLAALRDDHSQVRRSAAGALKQLEPQSPEVVPALLAALRDDHPDVRSSAAFALGHLGPQSPEVVPALLAALQDDHSRCSQFGSRGAEATGAAVAGGGAGAAGRPAGRPFPGAPFGSRGAEATGAAVAGGGAGAAGRPAGRPSRCSQFGSLCAGAPGAAVAGGGAGAAGRPAGRPFPMFAVRQPGC